MIMESTGSIFTSSFETCLRSYRKELGEGSDLTVQMYTHRDWTYYSSFNGVMDYVNVKRQKKLWNSLGKREDHAKLASKDERTPSWWIERKWNGVSETTQQFRDWRSSETANVTSECYKSSALYFQLRVRFKQPAIKWQNQQFVLAYYAAFACVTSLSDYYRKYMHASI
jgi:hypothetical protein